jgi:hypothetical protein
MMMRCRVRYWGLKPVAASPAKQARELIDRFSMNIPSLAQPAEKLR